MDTEPPIILVETPPHRNKLLLFVVAIVIIAILIGLIKIYYPRIGLTAVTPINKPSVTPTVIQPTNPSTPTQQYDQMITPQNTNQGIICASSGLKLSITLSDQSWQCTVDEQQGVENLKVTFPTGEITITTTALGRGYYCLPPAPEDMCEIGGVKGVIRGSECIPEPGVYECEVEKFFENDILILDLFKNQGMIGEIYGTLKNNIAYVSIVFYDKTKKLLTNVEKQELIQLIESIKIIE